MTHQDTLVALYLQNWDPEAGLWTQPGPGHTPDTLDLKVLHPGREAAWRLVAAGMDGILDRLEPGRVLRELRALQALEGPRRGCFRWFREERAVHDTNAGFFTSLALLVLHHEFGSRLAADDRALLGAMLEDAAGWFESELKDLPHQLRYPNKCLGDLVCAWLLAEISGRPSPALAEKLKQGAAYYRDNHWGWGEHLSDLYASVCQVELTALLLYARDLEPALRADYEWLFRDLNALDALFAGGPRVPAIRSYSLQESPRKPGDDPLPLRPFLETLEPWSADCPKKGFLPLKSLAYARGFKARYAVNPGRPGLFDVACFGGTTALSRITASFRMGALSRYPLMADTEHPGWGLCWQSMPVCYWNPGGDWAFLQWEATENGVARAHPAFTRHHRGQVQLTGSAVPPIVGETFSVRAGLAFLVLRRMPRLAPDWPTLVDRFRLLASSAASVVESVEGDWQALTLVYAAVDGRPEHRLRILFRPLGQEAALSLVRPGAGRLDWEARYPLEKENRPGFVAGLWVWQADEVLPPPPVCQATGSAWSVTFPDAPPHAAYRISPDEPDPRWSISLQG